MHRAVVTGGDKAIRVLEDGAQASTVHTFFFLGGQYLTRKRSGTYEASYPGIATLASTAGGTTVVPWLASPSSATALDPGASLSESRELDDARSTIRSVNIERGTNAGPAMLTLEVNPGKAAIWDIAQPYVYIDGRRVHVQPLESNGKEDKFVAEVSSQQFDYGMQVETGLFSPDLGFSLANRSVLVLPKAPLARRLIGAFVGINNYRDTGLQDLKLATGDAAAIKDIFSSDAQLHGGESILRSLPAERVGTKEDVLRLLQNVADTATEDDVLVIFMAGHGVYVNGRFAFVAHDARAGDNTGRGLISAEELVKVINSTRARRVVLFLDACESGSLNEAWFHSYNSAGYEGLFGGIEYKQSKSVYVISAAPNYVAAREGWRGRGLFTRIVMDALLGEGRDKDATQVTAEDVARYIVRNADLVSRRVMNQDIRPVVAYGTANFPLVELNKSQH